MAIKLANGDISALYLGSQAVSAAYLGSSTVYSTASTFAPSDITGLQLWLDASDDQTLYDATTGGSLVAADGSVARWEDKSGNDYHMTQATAGSRPARKTAIQGGLDVLRFDGSVDFMSVPSSTATFKFFHAAQATIFVVFSTSNTINAAQILGNRTSGADIGAYIRHFNATDQKSILHVATDGIVDYVFNASASSFFDINSFRVLSLVSDVTASASSRSRLRVNGGSAEANNTDGSTASQSNASRNLSICANHDGSGLVLAADICEIIIYNSALSDTDREAVEDYLIAKWSIT